jgi:hypothetical protein
MKNLIKRTSVGLALGLLGLATGCDDSAVSTEPYCKAVAGVNVCDPAEFPYVTELGTRSDACPDPGRGSCDAPLSETTAVLSTPEDGKVCLKGTVAGREGFAWLIVQVSKWTEARFNIVETLDAKKPGITELRFNVENPPAEGLTMFATSAHTRHCDVPAGCLNGFDFTTGPRSNIVKVIDESGPVRAPFTDFARSDDPNLKLDTTQLAHFIFVLGAGNYDFCIDGFKFVDISGNEVPARPDVGASSDAGAAAEASPDAGADAGASEGG